MANRKYGAGVKGRRASSSRRTTTRVRRSNAKAANKPAQRLKRARMNMRPTRRGTLRRY